MTALTPEQRDDIQEDGLRACGICGDYTAQGVEVHEVCLAALRAPVAATRAPRPGEDGLRAARTELGGIAARMVRLDGGCEQSHRRGNWHMHETSFHAIGRQLAAIYRATLRAPVADAGLDPERPRIMWRWPEADLFAALDAEGWFRGMATDEASDAVSKVYARLAATEPDASFDDPVLEADPAPTWKGGLLGTDRPLTTIPEA